MSVDILLCMMVLVLFCSHQPKYIYQEEREKFFLVELDCLGSGGDVG